MSFLKSGIVGLFLSTSVVSVASAEDCFPKIRAAEARVAAPVRKVVPHHRAHAPAVAPKRHKVRQVKPVHRPKRVQVAAVAPGHPAKFVGSSFLQRAVPVYTARPVECDKEPTLAMLSTPPGIEKPPMQKLLDELVEAPVASAAAPGVPDDVGVPSDFDSFPGGPGGGGFAGGGFPGGGGGGGGGVPPTVPPDVPPDTPIIDQPPVIPPDQPPPTAVPEPATWAMLILGYFGLGVVLRSGRSLANRKSKA